MTEGSNQGLIVIVAIIIFGIFVTISYLLFQDQLNIGLSEIFEDGLEQAQDSMREKWNNAYEYNKILNNRSDISFFNSDGKSHSYSFDYLLNTNDIQDINMSKENYQNLYKDEQGRIYISQYIRIIDRTVKQEYLEKGFKEDGKHESLFKVTMNGKTGVYKRETPNWSNTGFTTSLDNAILLDRYVKIGEVFSITFKDFNTHGGVTTTTVKLRVNIVD